MPRLLEIKRQKNTKVLAHQLYYCTCTCMYMYTCYSLRAERDELKKKLRSVMDDFQKLQEASVALANDNKVINTVMIVIVNQLPQLQWNLSIVDTIGTGRSVLIKEVSPFQR